MLVTRDTPSSRLGDRTLHVSARNARRRIENALQVSLPVRVTHDCPHIKGTFGIEEALENIRSSIPHDRNMSQAWRSDLEANYITLQEAHLALQKRCRAQQAIIEHQISELFDVEARWKVEHTSESKQSPAHFYIIVLKSLVNSIQNYKEGLVSETDITDCLTYHEKVHELISTFPIAYESTVQNVTPHIEEGDFEYEASKDSKPSWNFNLNTTLDNRMKEDIDQHEYNSIRGSLERLREEDTTALKIQQVIKEIKSSPEKILIVLLRHVSSLLKVITPYKKAQIMNEHVRCDKNIHGILMDFVESYLQFIPKNDSEVSSIEKYSFEDGSGVSTSEKSYLKLDSIDEEEEKFMETLPENIRQYFREICFAKWTKDWIPLLVLSPYDVIGDLREKWKKNYENYKNKKRPMKHLVVWYGSRYEDEMFGWVTEIIPYDKAVARSFNRCPERILKKIECGEKLTWKEKVIADAFEEAKEALELPKSDRWIRSGGGNCEDLMDGTKKENQGTIISSPLPHPKNNVIEPHVQDVKAPSRKRKVRKISHELILSSRKTRLGQRNEFEEGSYTDSNSSEGIDHRKISTSSFTSIPVAQNSSLQTSTVMKEGSSKTSNSPSFCYNMDKLSNHEVRKEKVVTRKLMEKKADEILSDAKVISSILEAYEKLNSLLSNDAPDDLITLISEKLKRIKHVSV